MKTKTKKPYTVTITMPEALDYKGQLLAASTETVSVMAESEGMAKTHAMRVSTHNARCRLVEFIVKKEA